jgi:hypothetical protein
MVVIPTMEEEAARRPSRERESLVNERSRITNRMKSALARLGIRGYKPHLRKAPERLAGLRTAEGTGLPANVIEEFRQTGIGTFLVVADFPSPSASTQVFFGLCRARRMLVSEPFNPTFFGRAGINSEPNRAAHRCSKRF